MPKNRGLHLYSLQFIIAVASILISLLPMTYMAFNIYGKYSAELFDNSVVFSNQIIEQLSLNIEDYLSKGIQTHDEVKQVLADNQDQLSAEALNQLNILFSNRVNVLSITAFDERGRRLFTVPNYNLKQTIKLEDVPNYQALAEDKIFVAISKPHIQRVIADNYDWTISYAKRATIKKGRQKSPIIISIDMSFEPLNRMCSELSLGGSGYVYLRDNQGNIIYHPNQAYVFSSLNKDKEKNTIRISRKLSFADWELIGVAHLDRLTKDNEQILTEVLATLPVVLLLIIVLSWLVSGEISRPIRQLQQSMQRVREGDFTVRNSIIRGEKEVVELAQNFNQMIEKIEKLMKEIKEKEAGKRKTELNALQAQINPHFLYNTLDSITWMAESGSKEEVVTMVTALARLFRISISKGKNIIPVEWELAHAENYLLIQKVRYKNRFNYSIDCDPAVVSLLSMKLVLQPLLENALYHGIEPLMEKGEIDVRAYRQDDYLIFEVTDNGVGMSEMTIQQISNGRQNQQKSKGSGVGTYNVWERLRISFGEEYGLTIKSDEEVGTQIIVRQPVMEEEDDEEKLSAF